MLLTFSVNYFLILHDINFRACDIPATPPAKSFRCLRCRHSSSLRFLQATLSDGALFRSNAFISRSELARERELLTGSVFINQGVLLSIVAAPESAGHSSQFAEK